MPTRATNTFEELLSKALSIATEMKQTPDADLPWVVQYETMVLQKIREPIDRMQALSQLPPGPMGGGPGGPGMGGLPGMGMGGPTSALGPGGPPMPAVPGVMSAAPTPSPDELRRMLSQ